MKYERLDKACVAKVLAVHGDRVLLTASWPATSSDERKGFQIVYGRANNTVEVSKSYFEKKYGVAL